MNLPDRVRLIVLFGGRSAEHAVSLKTASAVLKSLDAERYEVVPIGISREGKWSRADAVDRVLNGSGGAQALPDTLDPTGSDAEPMKSVQAADSGIPVVVLPLLHGPQGEDGTVQGLLELAGVPYVGSGVLSSALAMDKTAAKEILAFHGLPQCGWESCRIAELDDSTLETVTGRLGFPLFVKPANMGSSVGVSKAQDIESLRSAIAEAARYDEWVVFEEAVVGRELECAVLGNEVPRASVVGEVVPGAEFYDFSDKYQDGKAKLHIPAPVSHILSDELRSLAVTAYRALRCEGFARVDFFWEEDGRGLLVNEINTIPGFTPISMYPKLWEATGLPYGRLIDELVALALDRHRRRSVFSAKA